MILPAASRAFFDLFSPEIRGVFWKVLGFTMLALTALWLAIEQIFSGLIGAYMPDLPDWAGWIAFIAAIVAMLGLALAVAMLLAPVSAVIAGFFLDDAAGIIERNSYPADPAGAALPLAVSLAGSARFFLVVVAANVLALFLLFVPGVNLVAFFLVNGYLIGREYFEFAAARYLGLERAKAFRKEKAGQVLAAGLLISAFLLVPILNLLTPLFAAIMMVHLFKALEGRQPATMPVKV